MKKYLKDALIVFTAVTLTSSTVLAMDQPKPPELHASSQVLSAAKAEPQPEQAQTPVVEETPTAETSAPVETAEEPVTPTPVPEPVMPKVDSTIPARVFCGSPAQRTWKSPLLVNATIGRDMAATKGWTGAQWDALYELWSCESSWNNFAQNPSSAFGIAQFLDSTWRLPGMVQFNCSKTVDAREQIRCGLEYIQVVYGTPASALAKHYRDNSY